MSAPPSYTGDITHNATSTVTTTTTKSKTTTVTMEDAVDDTEDLSDGLVQIQRIKSDERRRRQSSQPHSIQDILPFHYSPLVRPLTISDLECCVALENAAFANPEHRCSRDKFEYRLTTCPELSMGIFCTVVPDKTKGWEIETLHTARPVDTNRGDGAVSMLMAHIVATRTHGDVVTDDAMDYPSDYKDNKGEGKNKCNVGHDDSGRTICIHSLAVHPKLQGVGMGKLIVKSYLHQVRDSRLASRVALICQEYLVDYYKRFGFTHIGPSSSSFGGGGWHDMVVNFSSPTSPRATH